MRKQRTHHVFSLRRGSTQLFNFVSTLYAGVSQIQALNLGWDQKDEYIRAFLTISLTWLIEEKMYSELNQEERTFNQWLLSDTDRTSIKLLAHLTS